MTWRRFKNSIPIRVGISLHTWMPGWVTSRTFIAPWRWQTHITIVPGTFLVINFGWIGFFP